MRMVPVILVTLELLLYAPASYSQELWVGKDGNIRNVDTRAMVIDDDGLYLATRNEIYMASDIKDKWQPVFSLPSGENEITCLGGAGRNILAGTRRGLFRSRDRGKNWKNVFRTMLPEKNNILSIEASKHNPGRVMIGTEKGAFLSEDAGDHWNDISGLLKNRRVKCVALNGDCAYACGEDGLYIRKEGSAGWERTYVQSAVRRSGGEESNDLVEVEEDSGQEVNCIAVNGARVYAGIGKRIIYSDDKGKVWHAFLLEGLGGTVVSILASERSDKLYCATTKGIFEYVKDKSRWIELYRGMDKMPIVNKIIFDTSTSSVSTLSNSRRVDGEKERSVWALTNRGVYRLESGRYAVDQYIDVERNLKSLKIVFDNEPFFRELQQAAMKFNEVNPDKIGQWRQQARIRALMPKVSLGLDKNRSTTAEIYTSATKDYIAAGPDDLTNGFDISVSWELGDLIWSDDQTNIDVRSRLTTQLRSDILEDLRRAYYERKRLQFELINNPPQDIKARFDKETRAQELTQAIDDLTGNYLSDHMKKAPVSSS